MTKQDEYARQLLGLNDPGETIAFLRRHSGLPGPRGNLELVQAAADVGAERDFRGWIEAGSGDDPTDEFLVVCGVVGLGRLVAESSAEGRRPGGRGRAGEGRECREDLVDELRAHASDPRWRVREGVAMALQRIGDAGIGRLLEIAARWSTDRPYVQRAAIAGVAEPRLLKTREAAGEAVGIVDRVTARLAATPAGPAHRRSDEFRTLRQALGYCWSVVAAADPEHGKARVEHWAGSADADVRWIIKENLKKTRLVRLDPGWVEKVAASLDG
jgi:hypothetical protein